MSEPQILTYTPPRIDVHTEPGAVRFVIIALAVLFLLVFVVLPLVVVFASAFSRGVMAYIAALSEPEALSAIRLTLLIVEKLEQFNYAGASAMAVVMLGFSLLLLLLLSLLQRRSARWQEAAA